MKIAMTRSTPFKAKANYRRTMHQVVAATLMNQKAKVTSGAFGVCNASNEVVGLLTLAQV